MVEERRTKLDVIIRKVIKLTVEQKGKVKKVMLQRKDFFLEALPLRWKHHFVLLLWSFLDTYQFASRL